MKPSEDELISHIKKTMAAHEEPYLPGAWENFNESTLKERKRAFGFYQFLNVAALLFICAFIFLYVDKAVETPAPEVVKNKPLVPANPAPKMPIEDDLLLEELTEHQLAEDPLAAAHQQRIYTLDAPGSNAKPLETLDSAIAFGEQYAYRAINPADQHLDPTSLSLNKTNQLADPVSGDKASAGLDNRITARLKAPELILTPSTQTPKPASEVLAFQDFLNQEQLATAAQKDQKANTTQQDKWEMGLMVAPSLGNNNKLNMGYGLSMGYALSKKVSLVSGISYNDMSASTQVPQPVSTVSLMAKNSRSLESVNASVSGIDVPLGVKYNLSKKLYANIGVSAFAVLNEHKDNTYLQETPVQSASTDPSSFGEMRIVVLNQRVTEEAPKSTGGNKYMGFYNLSFGVKQPLSGKNTLSLEPFIKLPMRETAADNLKLIGTGIKLKLDF